MIFCLLGLGSPCFKCNTARTEAEIKPWRTIQALEEFRLRGTSLRLGLWSSCLRNLFDVGKNRFVICSCPNDWVHTARNRHGAYRILWQKRRNLIRKPLVSYRALSGNPTTLGIRNERFLDQVPTLPCTSSSESPASFNSGTGSDAKGRNQPPPCHYRLMGSAKMSVGTAMNTQQSHPAESSLTRVSLTFFMHFFPSGVFQKSVKEESVRLLGSKAWHASRQSQPARTLIVFEVESRESYFSN